MQAIRITHKLESDTLHLPQLRAWVGKQVEIIVLESAASPSASDQGRSNALVGSVLRDDDPFGPAVAAEEWEANR